MIIGIGGRMGSGKTLLSSELIKQGFVKVSFADYLKKILSEIYNFNINLLNTQDGKTEILSVPLEWNKEIAVKLFNLVGIYDYNAPIINRKFNTRRELMQYIGSDILRKYDIDFHVNKTIQGLDYNKDYIFDDFRFPNELHAIKILGATSYYILRPNYFNISNHISETSINWTNFEYHIINDRHSDQIKSEFMNSIKYINYSYKKRKNNVIITRELLLNTLKYYNFNTELAANDLKCSRDKVVGLAKLFLINLPYMVYIHDKKAFLLPSKESAYYAGLISAAGRIKTSENSKLSYVMELRSDDFNLVDGLKNFIKSNKPILSKKRPNGNTGYSFAIRCPYIIENLKYWNLKPSKNNEIPDIIRDNNKLLRYWLLGLIDGNGSIYIDSSGKLVLSILASKQIIDFYKNFFSYLTGNVSNYKKIDNLYEWKLYDKDVMSLYYEIYDSISLNRKWSEIQSKIVLQ